MSIYIKLLRKYLACHRTIVIKRGLYLTSLLVAGGDDLYALESGCSGSRETIKFVGFMQLS